MLRTLLKLAVIVGLSAIVAVVIYQQARINRLRESTAALRQQLRQQSPLHDVISGGGKLQATDDTGANSRHLFAREESRELLRLRGEVGVLRRQLAEALDQAAKEQAKQRVSQPQAAESDLNDEQKKMLADWTNRIKTGNSVEDIGRLKDSLKGWEEWFVKPAPEEQQPVFVLLKEIVKERIAELEEQK